LQLRRVEEGGGGGRGLERGWIWNAASKSKSKATQGSRREERKCERKGKGKERLADREHLRHVRRDGDGEARLR